MLLGSKHARIAAIAILSMLILAMTASFAFAAPPQPTLGLTALRDKLDPNKSNGGVLLGLKGVVVKSHGGTNAEGFAYAVDVGYEMVRCDLLTKISALVQAQIAQEVVS